MTNLVNGFAVAQEGQKEVSTFVHELFEPQTLPGALLYGVVFAFFAWLFGRAVRLAVHRLLKEDTHGALDRTTVAFLAQLAQLLVYIFAFVSYAHLVPALQK